MHVRYDAAADRDAALLEVLDRLPRPAIVYTTLVAHAERLFKAIKGRGYDRLALFTGQVDDGDASLKIVNDWHEGKLDMVIGRPERRRGGHGEGEQHQAQGTPYR